MISKLASVILIFTCAMALGVAQQKPSRIQLNDSISTTTSPPRWQSPSGLFAFGFYRAGSGFAVGAWLVADTATIIWTANRDDEPIPEDAQLRLTGEGLKLLLSTGDKNISNLSSDDSRLASYASMNDSGNFIIYSIQSEVIWQTFDHPTDTIMAGQTLQSDQQLVSSFSEANHSTGRFCLRMQGDGNLVMYPVDIVDSRDAYWATGTYGMRLKLFLNGSGETYLIADDDTFQIYFQIYWKWIQSRNEAQQSTIYFARVDPDGFFRLYSHDGKITVRSARIPEVNDTCQIKGTCGLNSYCNSTGDQGACLCLPGFDYVDANTTFKGCQRNFTGEGCQIGKDDITYTMYEMDNITWLDDTYDPPLEVKSKDECRDACLKDCNCRAALLISGACHKQKFPFKYGTRSGDEPNTAFLKVGSGSPPVVPDTIIKKEPTIKILIVYAAIAACIPMVAAGVGFFICKNSVARYRKQWQNMEIALSEGMAPRSFSYSELRRATNGFSVQLGKGGFGTVFKGTLSNGETTIAVKKLEKAQEENRRSEKMVKRGERAFQIEIKAIGKTHHRNLIRLLGFCQEGSNRLLVYEYMSNGSLADIIFDPERWPRWSERVRIASDVAKGILYLHEGCEKPIIHSDIKPQNILIDENGTAKISDFGLAKLLMPTQTRTETDRRGTPGYVAPEWKGDTLISTKVDVYSFGIVLLELVCCRQIIDAQMEPEEIVLTEWVYNCLQARELEKLLRDEEAEMAELERLVKIGLWCIQPIPDSRPSMKKVMMMLDGNLDASHPPSPNPRN